MTVLEILQTKVTVSTITETQLQQALDEVEQEIKNYCNIDEVPEELNYTWANMAMDLVLYGHEVTTAVGADITASADASDVSSIQVGDTRIELKGNAGESARAKALRSHKPNLDTLLFNYRSQLNKFRRMVW